MHCAPTFIEIEMRKSPLLWFIVLLVIIAIYTSFGPAEATLGTNVRVVYLHGVWVWAALAAFITAGAVGLVAFILHFKGGETPSLLHSWSRAFGRTGLFFWITYLPISMRAMQANWNGLFLAEPRWRLALVFAITGLLLQAGLSFLPKIWSSGANLLYVVLIFVSMANTEKVMHPPGPMVESEFGRIQLFFGGLTLLTILAAWQVARWFNTLERSNERR